MRIEGFGGRGGFGQRPALAVIDMTLGFTDPDSPLACDLEKPVEEISRLLEAAREAAEFTWALQHAEIYTLAWIVLIMAVFIPLSIRTYQRTVLR